ncbi:CDGSH iron-sulfur domain-containing protein 3, partial [Blattella germanica]
NYSWCLCGQNKSQPICDGAHKNPYVKIKQRPIKFQVEETKEYWICNCKQTANRPFCDGTHKRADIQDAIR